MRKQVLLLLALLATSHLWLIPTSGEYQNPIPKDEPELPEPPLSDGNFTLQENMIPRVDAKYEDYSFVFSLGKWFIRIRAFVLLTNGSIIGMKTIVTWLKARYPNVNYATLLQRTTTAIRWGFNFTKLPTAIVNNVEAIAFKLVDLNFPLSEFKLEYVPNATRIHIPKAGLSFSFEDLFTYGYTVTHYNSTWVLVGNVKGKTDLFLDPVTFSSSIITFTGYTAGSPCTYNTIYSADIAGTATLRNSYLYAVNLTYPLTYALRPTDAVVLKVRFVVSGVNGSGVNVTLYGTDASSMAQTEVFSLTTATTYTSTKWWKSINIPSSFTVSCFARNNATFSFTQPRWGYSWRFGARTTTYGFKFDCKIHAGDGSTATYFTDTVKTIMRGQTCYTISTYDYWTKVFNRTTFTLGNLLNSYMNTTRYGCLVVCDGLSLGYGYYSRMFYGNAGSIVKMYDTTFSCDSGYYERAFYGETGCSATLIDVKVHRGMLEGYFYAQRLTANGNNNYVLFCVTGIIVDFRVHTWGNSLAYFENFKGTNITRMHSWAIISTEFYVKNPYRDFHVIDFTGDLGQTAEDIAIVYEGTNCSSYRFYADYTFYLRVTDSDYNPIVNATVTLTYGGLEGELPKATWATYLTDGNGEKTTDTGDGEILIPYAFWNKTRNSYSHYAFSPYVLTVEKEGYETYNQTFYVNKPIHWEISLVRARANFIPGMLIGTSAGAMLIFAFIGFRWKRKKNEIS